MDNKDNVIEFPVRPKPDEADQVDDGEPGLAIHRIKAFDTLPADELPDARNDDLARGLMALGALMNDVSDLRSTSGT